MNSETKQCQNCKQNFTIESEDFDFYKKIDVPPPTFCPRCRKQRRLAWRNDINLYSRKCDLCEKNIISLYSPDSGLTVYCIKCWWSDKWDYKDYGQEYDSHKPFFLQFNELQRKVPILALANDDGLVGGSLNCEYTQDFARAKNCYMVFVAWKLEDSMYSHYILDARGMVDCLSSWDNSDSVYEGIFAERCYHSKYAYYSVALSNCAFCLDCRDCSDCFMCTGLRHKQYCFKNEQYTKVEYEKILSDYKLHTYSGVEKAKKEFQKLLFLKPRKFSTLRNTINSTGDYLSNCKNMGNAFLVQRGENCRYVESEDTPKDCYDLSTGGELEQCYEGITPDNSYKSRFSIFSWKNRDVFYVDGCHSSEYIFGCCGTKKAKYCILNKQYTKEEYETLLPKIKEDMNKFPYIDKNGIVYKFGEFFPAELSYFGYNESVAQDHFLLTKDEALKKNFNWREKVQMTTGKETLKPQQIPDSIENVEDQILNEVLLCIECNRNYRVVLQELQFYRQMGIPLPRRCFYCRHKARVNFRNPFSIWHRACQCAGEKSENGVYKNTVIHQHGTEKCPNEFETSYAPERPEIVYCEQCYQAEVL